MLQTAGIHHITAIVNDPQVNYDFYSQVLGLRLVKKTVNFDRPEVYHLYFGNESGDPGTVITFFPWPKLTKGRIGSGQVGTTSYAIPKDASTFWKKRLKEKNILFKIDSRFDERYIQFQDSDGLQIELVERDLSIEKNSWTTNEINREHAIIGFSGATLFSKQPQETANILENILGMEFSQQDGDYIRFQTVGVLGNMIDIKLSPTVRGLAGAGTIHHIAWRANNEEQLQDWHAFLESKKIMPTKIKERQYFKALYFSEAGGMLFEIATDLPGFAVDEVPEKLGEKLMLPEWYEEKRPEFEKTLPSIKTYQ